MTVEELFYKHEDEYLNYRADPFLLGKRHDVIVITMLDQLVPTDDRECQPDLIISSTRDEIYFGTNPEKLMENATEDQIILLIRCGLRYDSDTECLCTFVQEDGRCHLCSMRSKLT